MDNGLAMGSSLSSFLSDIFMKQIEKQIQELNLIKHVTYWVRYVEFGMEHKMS